VHRVLVLGVPRSGTTWIGEALGRTERAVYVHEPDGVPEPFAYRAKFRMEHHPILTAGAEAPEYERLWAGAFAGGRRAATVRDRIARRAFAGVSHDDRMRARLGGRMTPRLWVAYRLAAPLGPAGPGVEHVVVKSVHAALASEWLVRRFAPRVVVTHRNPLNVMASWLELGFPRASRRGHETMVEYARARWAVELPGYDAEPIRRDTAYLGVLLCALRDDLEHHTDWEIVSHEAVCGDPGAELAGVAARLDLVWGDAAEEYLAASNRPGSGWETRRVAEDLPNRWRTALSETQVREIRETLAVFPYDLFDPLVRRSAG
jgi:hypothetical protein